MIKKIDILNYGVFKDFCWSKFIGSEPNWEFGSRNIIYGRNYAGKTTLSRIVRSLQMGKQHKDFLNGKFMVTLEDGKQISEADLSQGPYNFRVYNSDFRKDNLNFLYDDNGEILPFTILGEENIELQRKIQKEREQLEKIKEEIANPVNGVIKKFNDASKHLTVLKNDLSKKLSKQASKIRNEPSLFVVGQKRKYDIRDLESEIRFAAFLETEKKKELINSIKEEIKGKTLVVTQLNFNYDDILKSANVLLSKNVKPSKLIQEISLNNSLEEWVRNGIDLHKESRESCAFCGNRIENSRWAELDSHFTKEVEGYNQSLESLLQRIQIKIDHIKNFNLPFEKNDFYAHFQADFNCIKQDLERVKVSFIFDLELIYNAIDQKRKNIFKLSDVLQISEDIPLEEKYLVEKITTLVSDNNTYTDIFTEKQNEARTLLRYNEIYQFMNLIDYNESVLNINDETETLEKIEREKKELDVREKTLERVIKELEASLKDEKNSVRQVNKYLKTFLGHPELYLEIEESSDEKVSKFTIIRNEQEAKNLSEGEQSLIAFCYFLATLKDISDIENYTIFIDDPICSLDSNHIFYIFSLLDSEITSKPYRQVFISTHNLDFLKYLQKITKPTSNKKYENKYYLIEKNIDNKDRVTGIMTLMPDYLKKYSTEFIYLFHQIYRVANEVESDENYQIFYGFPNSARKFIETYMFFKYPDFNMSNDKRIQAFFENKLEIKAFLNRINNEFSHGENQPDRLLKPLDIPEFRRNAKIILDAIRKNDEEQYYAFLGSLGVMPEIEHTENIQNKDVPVL
ncbi:AAA family ATPase [Fictibacillus sp. 5RED26]|uniref:AAA family ATPase n=1 Tax=Fictibacillus sp. 5RED26 TaxID=2745876 RepID=UPI0018CD8898|nr:AAA family ATPase [Fictibacillus sp. 5RED26]MBH0158659.1 AAA family ATPase [Fictibacillus sp. 5RED26]